MSHKFGGILGFDNGVVLAPMGVDISGPKLVAAVANAGGIGLLASPTSYEETQKAIKEIKKLTRKPFGAGILLEFDYTGAIQAIFEEKLACMQVYWGDYPKELVDKAHENGVKILHQIGSVKDAEKAVAAGVDCIIAQGVEAGGHIVGTDHLTDLLPKVVAIAGSIPVVAAGGIADASGYAAALALGASGVCLGTRFVASEEAYAHDYYKQQLVIYKEGETSYTDLYSRASWRAPVRCLNTPFHNKWKGVPESVENNEDQPIIGYSLIYGGVNMVMYAGKGVGFIKEILPAATIVKNLVEGTKEILINEHKKHIGGA